MLRRADVKAQMQLTAGLRPRPHPHNVPGILVSPFLSFFFFPTHSVEATLVIFVPFQVFPFIFYYVFL